MLNGFSALSRQKQIQKLSENEFDILIVGGGITGAGTARDAASRGLSVGLVEASDFASGTSSRSSKLIHGGLRYLENMEFHLVFEALSERHLLFELAPHLVHPLRFVIPLFEGGRVGMFKMGLGMWAYDILSLFDAPEMHERLDPELTKLRVPVLRDQGLMGSYVYSDAYMDDDRLTLETLRSANQMGVTAANYCRVKSAEFENGKICAVVCFDELTHQTFRVRAKHFVGSVGPWTDIFGETILKPWKRQLRPTKGVHLTLDRNRLPLNDAVVMAADAEKRIIFAIPRHEMIIIGTTDTEYNEDPSLVHTEQKDVDYILKIVGQYFPDARLTEKDILASYSGVRPLVHDGSDSESSTSREHKIWTDSHGITFVAGGKYTTYRRMASDIVDEIQNHLPPSYFGWMKPSNTQVPLNPLATREHIERAHSSADVWASESGFSVSDVRWLIDRHGSEAEILLQAAAKERLKTIWEIEVFHAIHHTMCLHLRDFYQRRTPLVLTNRDHGWSHFDSIAGTFARYLGWNEAIIAKEKVLLQDMLSRELSWQKN